jgi:uncharacterized SAM-binding protein YcdF (DUF218 family)
MPHSAVIVIFGAAVKPDGSPSVTLRRRIEAAAKFGARFPAPLFLPTGAVGRFGASEASVMAGLLGDRGVGRECIMLEETGTDTLSSVRAVARLVRDRAPEGPIFAATSAYHLPRCLLLLRLAGVAARACPPPAARGTGGFGMLWYWRLRELAATPVDLFLMVSLRLFRRA